jgi:hypothetical protein
MLMAPGAFIMMGIIIMIINYLRAKKGAHAARCNACGNCALEKS